jgi:hypothetical protein
VSGRWPICKLTKVFLGRVSGFMEGRPEWEDVFRPYQQMLVEGDYMSRHNYSRSLASIAEYGPDVFYGKQPGQGKDDQEGRRGHDDGRSEGLQGQGLRADEDDVSGQDDLDDGCAELW